MALLSHLDTPPVRPYAITILCKIITDLYISQSPFKN